MIVNMKPYLNLDSTTKSNPYHIRISSQTSMIDQKRGLIELKPGYMVSVKVIPQVVEASKEFESFEVKDRKCKEPHETDGFKLTHFYTRIGCEFECALSQALQVCKCLPWYYPNNFTETPICDMFGAKCFDMIISDETYYKKCPVDCLEDCKEVTYVGKCFKSQLLIFSIIISLKMLYQIEVSLWIMYLKIEIHEKKKEIRILGQNKTQDLLTGSPFN